MWRSCGVAEAFNRGDYDAPHMSPITPDEDARTILINKISWSAVLAGVVVALVTQLILNMLGVGIGGLPLLPREMERTTAGLVEDRPRLSEPPAR